MKSSSGLDRTQIRHIKASIEALERVMQPMAVNYHLYDQYQVETAKGDWKRYKKYLEAREYWEDLLEGNHERA